MNYISSEPNFEGFIMNYYLTFQRTGLPTNTYEEENQGGNELPKVDSYRSD